MYIIDICENTYIPGKIRNDKYSKQKTFSVKRYII